MPGMNSGINVSDPTVVAAFKTALVHQGLPLPPLPPRTATLAPGPGGTADALAVRRGTLTVWQHVPGGPAWAKVQVLNVPIQYGSSS